MKAPMRVTRSSSREGCDPAEPARGTGQRFALLAIPTRGQPVMPVDSLAGSQDTSRVVWADPFAVQLSSRIPARTYSFEMTELLREQLTRRYAREIPYALTVEVERFEEHPKHYSIGAVIWVEREGQKAIIIGKQGDALKETARLARESMQNCFQKKVWLDVWVKVKRSWSSDERAMANLGYTDP